MSIEAPKLARHVLSGATMGTRYSATILADDTLDMQALKAALFASVDLVDRQMSTWKPDSDLMRINQAEVGDWVVMPPELAQVIHKALEIGRASDGAFDIAVGGIVAAWGFGASGGIPDNTTISAHLATPPTAAFEALEVSNDGCSICKRTAVQLDLSGIAKGFAVDQMIACVQGFGLKNALAALDGELRSIGADEGGKPWAIAIEKPDYDKRAPMGVFELCEQAIATSGDYRHWIDVGAARLSHTMDRKSGGPTRSPAASVTVVTTNCMEADAWATALLVKGRSDGPKLADAQNLSALFIFRENDKLIDLGVGPQFVAEE